MKVIVNAGQSVVVPKLCPCCLGRTASVERLGGSDWTPFGLTEHTVELDFPVCDACLAHRKEGRSLAAITLGAGAALLAIGFLLREVLGARQGSLGYVAGEICAILFAASLAFAPAVFFWHRSRWPKHHPPHARAGRAVSVYPGYDTFVFKFANEEYGRIFKEANASNLDRLSP